MLTHQPPEFQDVSTFRGLERTTNHDNFGLAVLIFQLLFMARHPFSGTFKGTGDMSLERAIHEYRFVYGKDAAKNEMAPPPASLDLSAVTPEVAELFERAFSKKGAKKGRPEAREWVKALENLQRSIRKCRSNPCHAYLKGRNCPFCAIESQTGSALFNLPILFKTKGGKQKTVVINVGTIWKEVRAVDGPGPTPVVPTDEVGGDLELDLPATDTGLGMRLFQIVLGLAAASGAVYFIPRTDYLSLLLLLVVPLLWFGRLTGPSGKLDETRKALEKLRRRWAKEASPREFLKMQVGLKEAKKDLENLDEEHDRIIEKLSAKKREHQLEAFLDRHRVAEASIPGIGRAACVVLESHGIETARNVWPERRLVMAYQPHRFTRTRDLYDDFVRVLSDPDLLVLLEVYGAGEEPIPGADGKALARGLRQRGTADPVYARTPEEALALLPGLLREDDVLLVQGAGNVNQISSGLTRSAGGGADDS